MLHLIIDGYNIIRAQPYKWNLRGMELQTAREELIYYLNNYLQDKEHKITLIFDAHRKDDEDVFGGKSKVGKVDVMFTQYGETADHLIKKMVEEIPQKSNMIVATSDREIINFVEKFRVKTISAMNFYHRIKPRGENLSSADHFEKYIKGYQEEEFTPTYSKKLKKKERRGPKLW